MPGFAHRIFACVTAVTLAVNALLCACGGVAAASTAAAQLQPVSQAEPSHCHGSTSDETPGDGRGHGDHDPSCPHCSGWEAVQPVTNNSLGSLATPLPAPAFVLLPLLFEPVAPPISGVAALPVPTRLLHERTLLRQHCALIV